MTEAEARPTNGVSPHPTRDEMRAVRLRLADRYGPGLSDDTIAMTIAGRYWAEAPPEDESRELGEALRARGVDTAELVRRVAEMLDPEPEPRARLGRRFHPAAPTLPFRGPAELAASGGDGVAWGRPRPGGAVSRSSSTGPARSGSGGRCGRLHGACRARVCGSGVWGRRAGRAERTPWRPRGGPGGRSWER